MPTRLTPAELDEALVQLSMWLAVDDGLERTVEFGSFPDGIAAVSRVAELAEELNHHPDIEVKWRTVTFRCSTHSAAAITDADVELASGIDRIIDDLT